MNNELIAKQIQREKDHILKGVERVNEIYKSAVERKDISSTGAAQSVVSQLIINMHLYMSQLPDLWASSNSPHNTIVTRTLLNTLPTNALSFLSVRAAINGIGEGLASVAQNITLALLEYVNYSIFPDYHYKERLQQEYENLNKGSVRKPTKAIRSRNFEKARNHLYEKSGITLEDGFFVNKKDEVVGITIYDEAVMALGLFILTTIVDCAKIDDMNLLEIPEQKGKDKLLLQPTLKLVKLLEDGQAFTSLLRPQLEPMIVPPKKWTDPTDGGYYTIRKCFIKKLNKKGWIQGVHEQGKYQKAYDTLNALQEVPHQVNKFVYETMKKLADKQLKLPEWPKFSVEDYPGYNGMTVDESWKYAKSIDKENRPPALKKWMTGWHEWNHEVHSVDRLNTIRKIQNALAFCSENLDTPLYEVYTMDSRLRVYPEHAAVYTQGTDFIKSLLEFHNGYRVTPENIDHLKIMCANCWANDKLDKKPLAERILWVEDNIEGIIQAGTDPLADLWWTKADSGTQKFRFLSTCAELAKWYLSGQRTMVSHLPIAFDGSCNGIQHWSAVLKNKAEGSLVNLIDNMIPQDIYNEVAKKVNEMAQALAYVDPNLLNPKEKFYQRVYRQLLKQPYMGGSVGCTRSMAKKPTMTYPYNISLRGIMDQFLKNKPGFDYLKEYVKALGHVPKQSDEDIPVTPINVAAALSNLLMEAIQTQVSSAYKGMVFLEQLAYAYAKAEKHPYWFTYDGIPIVQIRKKSTTLRLRTPVSGLVQISKNPIEEQFAKIITKNWDYRCYTGLMNFTKEHVKEVESLINQGLSRDEAVGRVCDVVRQHYEFTQYLISKNDIKQVKEQMRRVLKQLIALKEESKLKRMNPKFLTTNVNMATDRIDAMSNGRAVGPNFIHSQDATHLRLTVKKLKERGINDFRFVHDEFCAPLTYAQDLHECLREAFVEMYENTDPLKQFIENAVFEDIDISKVEIPEPGNLDIREVINSTFFFR